MTDAGASVPLTLQTLRALARRRKRPTERAIAKGWARWGAALR
jgi:hypothetical protein